MRRTWPFPRRISPRCGSILGSRSGVITCASSPFVKQFPPLTSPALRLSARADRSPGRSLPRLRRLRALQPQESVPPRGANPRAPILVVRHADGRVAGRVGGLVLRGKENQSAVPSSQHELALGSPPAITVARAELERKGAGRKMNRVGANLGTCASSHYNAEFPILRPRGKVAPEVPGWPNSDSPSA
jgi:hypothetical protein